MEQRDGIQGKDGIQRDRNLAKEIGKEKPERTVAS